MIKVFAVWANDGLNQRGQPGRNEKRSKVIPRLVESGVRLIY